MARGREDLRLGAFCIMAASQRELVDVVTKWISRHPNILSYEADGLVAAALSETLPRP